MGSDRGGEPPVPRRSSSRDRELLVASVLFLVLVGGALIGLIYGKGALAAGLPCLIAGAAVIVLLYALLGWMDRWANR